MSESHQPGRSFFWPGLLFLLPMAVLASAGFVSLRQDRILARHEAIDKAQTLADQIATSFWTRLFDRAALTEFPAHSFRVDARGNLFYPPSEPLLPTPARLDASQLNEAQQSIWATIAAPGAGPFDRTLRIESAQKFLASGAPPLFAAAAQFQLAQDLLKDEQRQEAGAQFEALARTFPDAVSESGLPLAALAKLKALEIAADTAGARGGTGNQAGALQALCSNLVHQPSFLSPHLLGRASELEPRLALTNTVQPWLREWSRHDALRELARAALAEFPPLPQASTNTVLADRVQAAPRVPALFWFHATDLSARLQPGFPPPAPIEGRSQGWQPNTLSSASLHALASSSLGSQPQSPSIPTAPPSTWDRYWLASRMSDSEGGSWILCRELGRGSSSPTNAMVGSPLLELIQQGLPALPPWLDYTLDVAGVTLTSSNQLHRVALGQQSKGERGTWVKTTSGISIPEVLASAARFENGLEYLRVNLHFVSPQLFYARQQTRTRLFGGLIGIASITGLVGFVSTRRAFLRQQQLNDLKSNFVSSVSHELRAPIASMRLLAESLQRGKVTDPARQLEYFRFLVQECRRLSALIENVLNFARIEQGRKQYELEPTDVVELLHQTVSLLEPAAAEKQLTLTLDLPEDGLGCLTPPPLLDGQAIQQALVNLIDNALKHSSPGQTVSVGLQCGVQRAEGGGRGGLGAATPGPGTVAEAGASLNLFVQDHGPGIPPEDHERIFERFYRRGSELRRETQGIGIGLSIVKHIAEAHGGKVRVESQPGQGSRFIIELTPRAGQPAAT